MSDTTTRRLRLQGMLMLTGAVVVGALIGVAGERLRTAASGPTPRRERAERSERGPLPPPFEQIGLSGDQRVQIIALMESRRARTESLMREFLPPLRAETDSIRIAIAELLTPEQLTALDEAFESMGRHRGTGDSASGWRSLRRGRGGPPNRRR